MGQLDLNRYIAKIRAESGKNFLALALQEIQDQWPSETSTPTSKPSAFPVSGGTVAPSTVTPVSTPFSLYVNGVLSTKNSSNLNNSMPPAPAGFASVGFTVDNTMPIPNIGAYAPSVGYVNNQTGASYTVLPNDFGKLVIFTNASAVTVTIDPTTVPINFFCGIASFGAGGLTITPASGTIDGTASLALSEYQGLPVYSDGTNLWTERGLGSAANLTPLQGQEFTGDDTTQDWTLANTPTGLCLCYYNGQLLKFSRYTVTGTALHVDFIPAVGELITAVWT